MIIIYTIIIITVITIGIIASLSIRKKAKFKPNILLIWSTSRGKQSVSSLKTQFDFKLISSKCPKKTFFGGKNEH